MHKLTNVEAQRVMTVLSETLDRLNALSVVSTQRDDEMVEQLQDEGCGAVVSSLDAYSPGASSPFLSSDDKFEKLPRAVSR